MLFVYVMMDVPDETAVTTPVFEIDDTEGVPDNQGVVPDAVALPVSVKVLPTQIGEYPVMLGNGFTVTFTD